MENQNISQSEKRETKIKERAKKEITLEMRLIG